MVFDFDYHSSCNISIREGKDMKKWHRGIIVFLIGGILIFAAFGAMMSTNVGGSLWQFDYAISEMTINGVAEGNNDYPNGDSVETTGGVTITPDVRGLMDLRSAYLWWIDIDGQPRYTGSEWLGLLPDVGLELSAPWRTDASGNKIDANAESQILREWTDVDGTHKEYLFYYAFDAVALTKQDAFTVPGTAQSLGQNWISHECGVMEIDNTIIVQMRKGMFGEVEGEFMDARILDVEVVDLQLQSGLDWVNAPSVAVMQDKNSRLLVYDREYGEDYYNCKVDLSCTLTPGLAKEALGFDVNKYEVWVRKTIQLELMLTEHLQIGELGEPISLLDPPRFQGSDILHYILIILLIIVAIVILIVLYKYSGVIGIIVGGRKS